MQFNRRSLLVGSSIAALLSREVFAGINNPGSGGGGSPTGSAQINIGAIDAPGAFINFMKGYRDQSFGAGAGPGNLDANGYPNTTLAANIGGIISLPAGFAPDSVTWVLKWPATTILKFVINVPVTKTLNTNATVTGGTASNMNVNGNGAAGRVEFNFNSYVGPSFSFFFPSGFANTGGAGGLVLVRKTDEAAYDAGAIFTPEFVALLRDLNPKTIRPMGWVNTGNLNLTNQVQWRYRTTPLSLSWVNYQFPPGVWAGSTTGTDAYTVAAASDTPLAGWVDGEVIQTQIVNAATPITITGAAASGGLVQLVVNSTASLTTGQSVLITGVAGTIEANGVRTVTVDDATHITLQGITFVNSFVLQSPNSAAVVTQTLTVTGKTGGAKFILSADAFSAPASSMTANSLANLVYDGLLGRLLYSAGGITPSVPIEAQVSLANTIRSNLWTVIPALADDTYVSTWATYVRNNLSAALMFYPEYSNEVWNFLFPQAQWATQRGLALGFPLANNEALHGWYGLRLRQIMGIITPIWSGRSNLKRVLAFQAFGAVSGTNTYRLQGSDLASVANGGQGNATWTSWTGGANYRNFPDRPVDYVDVLSYATYYSGANFNNGFSYTAASAVFLQSLADNYNSGVPAQIATALADLDNDIRAGTKSAVLGNQTLLGLSNVPYPGWETIVAGYTGKTVEGYEGGNEILAPTTQQCTDIGIAIGVSAAAASAALDGLSVAYKNSSYGLAIVGDQFTQFLVQSHSRNPSWLSITGPNQWSLLPGDLFSTPYQTYSGFRAFNH